MYEELVQELRRLADEQFFDFEKSPYIKAADVVLRSCFDRILAENDDMREQLKSVGKLPGDDMSDLEVVRHGRWVHGREVGREYLGDCLVGIFYDRWTCSECGYVVDDHEYSGINYKFCPNCGAKMKGGVNE